MFFGVLLSLCETPFDGFSALDRWDKRLTDEKLRAELRGNEKVGINTGSDAWKLNKMSTQTYPTTTSHAAAQKRSIIDVLQELQRQIQVSKTKHSLKSYSKQRRA